MKYHITHATTYQYSQPASLSQNEVFLCPRSTSDQQVLESRLDFDPQPEYLHRRTDYFGNVAQVFMVQQPHSRLSLTATSVVLTAPPSLRQPEMTLPWENARERLRAYATVEELEAYQYAFASPLIAFTSEISDYGRLSFSPGTPLLVAGIDLMRRIYKEFTYDKTVSTVDTPLAEVMVRRRGVCQDFAHLAIACLRSLGLAARYVSGYLETLPPPGKPKLVGADASHAWLSLYVPGTGWVDLDPTNNIVPGESHITLAWGRDYSDVAPAKGVVMGGGSHTLEVKVEVNRIV